MSKHSNGKADEAGKGELADEEFRRVLVLPYFSQGLRSRTEAFLLAFGKGAEHAHRLGSLLGHGIHFGSFFDVSGASHREGSYLKSTECSGFWERFQETERNEKNTT